MKPLLLDEINASAPYEVYWHEKSRTYRFKSDFGVVLAIGFDDDDIIENAESYVFSIINVNKIPSPRDLKMRDTVMLIIENFSSNPQPIGFRGNLLVKRQKFFYCTYSLGITETS